MLGRVVLTVGLAAVVVATYALTGLVRRQALRRGMLDVPNERSSHLRVTPRGGGLAIAATTLLCALLIYVADIAGPRELLAWCVGGGLVALAGLLDDRWGLSARFRLLIHSVASCVLVWAANGMAPLPWFGASIDLGWFGLLVMAIAVVWSINLFNFMDGIDGLAASQAVFVAGAGAALAVDGVAASPSNLMAVALAAATLGFLAWNWPPARIFMGDVGSGFLGFMLAACMFLSVREGSSTVWTWLTLHGAFLADATVTLLVRLARGERIYEAHRTHAYQHLARRWRSHRPVGLVLWAINLGWLLPLAALGTSRPEQAPLLCFMALVPLFAGAVAFGSGWPERTVPGTGG